MDRGALLSPGWITETQRGMPLKALIFMPNGSIRKGQLSGQSMESLFVPPLATKIIPPLTSDSSSGVIITWQDSRVTSSVIYNVYAQRVNSQGSTLWLMNGIAIATVSNFALYPTI